MLQQTQVGTVIDYFNRFMTRFPDVVSLASANIDDVLKQWEGLGYYRRARQLQAAAKQIVESHGGRFPEEFDAIQALPGIGRYTAGAIASIALGHSKPILEGNTIRLFSRLTNLDSDPRTGSNQKRLWEFSESILSKKRPGDFNQALMDLGSMICKPKQPSCLVCPVAQFCDARSEGTQDHVPVAAPKKKFIQQNEAVVIVVRKKKFFVRLCGPEQRWAGLWDFPRFIVPPELAGLEQQVWLMESTKKETGYQVSIQEFGVPIQHAVTKYKISLSVFITDDVVGRAATKESDSPKWKWISFPELESLAMSSTGRKIVRRLQETKGFQ